MIGVFGDKQSGYQSGQRLPITYNGITLNQDFRTLVTQDLDIYEVNSVNVSSSYDYVTEVRQSKDGQEAYKAKKINLNIRIDGIVRCENIEKLYDRISDLCAAFDPANVSMIYPDAYATKLVVYTPSAANGTATNVTIPGVSGSVSVPAGNLIQSYYLCRPKSIPTIMFSEFNGTSVPFSIDLIAVDPRRYTYAVHHTDMDSTLTKTLFKNDANFSSWPLITIGTTGAASSTFGMSITSNITGTNVTKTLTINLSSAQNGDTYYIDMAKGSIQRVRSSVTTDQRSLYVSGDFWDVPPASSSTFTISSSTGISLTGSNRSHIEYNRAHSV